MKTVLNQYISTANRIQTFSTTPNAHASFPMKSRFGGRGEVECDWDCWWRSGGCGEWKRERGSRRGRRGGVGVGDVAFLVDGGSGERKGGDAGGGGFTRCGLKLVIYPQPPSGLVIPSTHTAPYLYLPPSLRRKVSRKKRIAYSSLILVPLIALIALEISVKFANAQFLTTVSPRRKRKGRKRTYFSLKKLTNLVSPQTLPSLSSAGPA